MTLECLPELLVETREMFVLCIYNLEETMDVFPYFFGSFHKFWGLYELVSCA